MTNPGAKDSSGQATLKNLSEGLLRSAGHTAVKGNLLEIHHDSAPQFDPVFLRRAFQSFGVSIRLSQDENGIGKQVVRCDSGELPFQDKVFQTVVLHHVVGSGDEPELAEAVRVLARDGVLLLLGLNHLGWRYRTQSNRGRLPGLSPLRVKDRLDALEMTMQGFAGAGLAGMNRPVWMHSGLASLGAPLADIVLMQARHADSPEVTPLRFRNPNAAIVQSAVMRG
jgi:SAM-dependent methyltransferase